MGQIACASSSNLVKRSRPRRWQLRLVCVLQARCRMDRKPVPAAGWLFHVGVKPVYISDSFIFISTISISIEKPPLKGRARSESVVKTDSLRPRTPEPSVFSNSFGGAAETGEVLRTGLESTDQLKCLTQTRQL
eukprot:5839136-Pleurochrysis_carterae.AAC.1